MSAIAETNVLTCLELNIELEEERFEEQALSHVPSILGHFSRLKYLQLETSNATFTPNTLNALRTALQSNRGLERLALYGCVGQSEGIFSDVLTPVLTGVESAIHTLWVSYDADANRPSEEAQSFLRSLPAMNLRSLTIDRNHLSEDELLRILWNNKSLVDLENDTGYGRGGWEWSDQGKAMLQYILLRNTLEKKSHDFKAEMTKCNEGEYGLAANNLAGFLARVEPYSVDEADVPHESSQSSTCEADAVERFHSVPAPLRKAACLSVVYDAFREEFHGILPGNALGKRREKPLKTEDDGDSSPPPCKRMKG